MSELAFGEEATSRFRQAYVAQFGPAQSGDQLYEAVSAGSRFPGQEHWLPLFHEQLETLLDYLPDSPLSLDHMTDQALADRHAMIEEHYQARLEAGETSTFGAPPYKPVPPASMYVSDTEWRQTLAKRRVSRLSAFESDDLKGTVRDFSGRPGRSFAPERAAENTNLFEAAAQHIRALAQQGKRTIVAAWTPGARERLATLLTEHGLAGVKKIESYEEALTIPAAVPMLAVIGLEQGFETPDLAIVAEQDILGDRLVRPRRRAKKAADVITEATSLSVGDLVVHTDHGIGRFAGLRTITALGAPHDCLELVYHGGDKLYLPVENIELLSRYGSDETGTELDRLGG
ncbi:MAG: CarD family transcriptional regulator, partial [Hyphomicrobiaceae bacterium]